jgi:exopolysaccharide biosynthesis polyprenyl glycosylphosphotransferase
MKKNLYKRNLFIPFLKMAIDALAVFAAVLFSYYLRFYSPLAIWLPPTKGIPSLNGYLYFAIFLVVVFVTIFSVTNAYRSRFFSTFSQDIPGIFKTALLGLLVAMSAAFLYRDFSYSRLVFALIFVNSILFVMFGRLLFHHIKSAFLKKGYSTLRVALVGSPSQLKEIYKHFRRGNHLNFDIIGYFANSPVAEMDTPHLGNITALLNLLQSETATPPEGLVLAFNADEQKHLWDILQSTEGQNIELFYIPDVLNIITSKFHTLEIGGIPLLQLKAHVLAGWQGFLKRTFDIVVSASSLVVLSPLFAVIAIIIKTTSPGPVFYRQKRVSLDGQEFEMIKFRSMRVDAEAQTGPVWAKANDPRVTPIGKILRRTSLDELPQLINVVKGEMSLVGPRPERKHFVDQFKSSVPKYLERHRVRCGMTGWAQVNGLRGQSSIEERTRYDLYYIENWSLWFDIKIILMTFAEIIRGENAY